MDYKPRGDTLPESFTLLGYVFPYREKILTEADEGSKKFVERNNTKIDLLCQSRMNLGHALNINLPDMNINSCRSYISQIQPHTGYRTGSSNFVDR